MSRNKVHSGQVALIMVLIMTVVSAVAVSMASRSTIQTRIQQMNVENTEALLTAQAGLEAAMTKNLPLVTGNLRTGQDYQVTLGDTGLSSIISEKINPGESFEVTLEGMAAGASGVNIYWNGATGGTPAIFVTEMRDDRNTDYAYDTDGTNGFTRAVTGVSLNGVNFTYATTTPINLVAGVSKKIRITVLGSPAFLGIVPVGGQLPPQFSDFKSTANLTGTSLNTVKYGLQYIESKTNQIPSVFDYVLFSGGSITQ